MSGLAVVVGLHFRAGPASMTVSCVSATPMAPFTPGVADPAAESSNVAQEFLKGKAPTLSGLRGTAIIESARVPEASVPRCEATAADLAYQAVHSNEGVNFSRLALYRDNAESVRARLKSVALDDGDEERARFLAAYLLVSIDEPALSETTIEVLGDHLSSGRSELRRQAMWHLPESLALVQPLVSPLSSLARREPSDASVRATDVLGRWGALDRTELIQSYARALEAEDEGTVDQALESPVLPTVESHQLAWLVMGFLTDGRHSAVWWPSCDGGLERRHAALVVLSRMPAPTRRWIRRSLGESVALTAEDEPLLRLCLDGPTAVSADEVLAMMDPASPSRTWAAVRVLIDQNALSGRVKLPAAQLTFRVHWRSGLFQMLLGWMHALPASDLEQLVVEDGTQGFRSSVERWKGLSFGK